MLFDGLDDCAISETALLIGKKLAPSLASEQCRGDLKMAHKTKEMKILATPEKGHVSALLIRPENARHLLVLGHGASTNMRHATLQTIAERIG